MIRKRIRHMKRYREIVTVLVKYGFGYIVRDVGLFHLLSLPRQIVSDFSNQSGEANTIGRQIRLMCEELGPTFIKLGQMLSLRSDLIPAPIANELTLLQDQVASTSPEAVHHIIQEELGKPADEVFVRFDNASLAAASIAEVHRAVLKNGDDVVVKIRRPHIESIVNTDIEIMTDLALLLEKHYEWAKDFQIVDVVDEFSIAVRKEMDYIREGKNTEKLYQFFSSTNNIIIPKVYWSYSTNCILTLEYIGGMKLSRLLAGNVGDEYDRPTIARRLVRSFLDQALIAGIYHGDPHPGNLFFFPENRIAYIDFGQVGILTEDMRENFASLIIGLMRGNTDLLFRTVFRMSEMPDDLNERSFKADLETLRDKYYNLPFSSIHMGEVVQDIFETTKKNHIIIPKDYTLLGKALITLEGIVTQLDNSISMLELAEPYGRRLMLNRLNPERVIEKLYSGLYDFADSSLRLPPLLKRTLEHLNKGKTRVEMELPELDRLLSKLDRAANRISFSILLLAFSIILGCVILGETFVNHAIFSSVPILDTVIAIVLLMFLVALFSIFRSGRF
ncbi:MAG: AarF/ABC1/UbiB kinase family protein [Sporolactobacillus sp.]|nr:AarF/ABC1/UbiB kinase family protein [Sporolactobacillus sp.]